MEAMNFTLLFTAFSMRDAGSTGRAGVNVGKIYRETGCQAWL